MIKRCGLAETSISPGVGFEFQKTGAISSYSLCFLFMNEEHLAAAQETCLPAWYHAPHEDGSGL